MSTDTVNVWLFRGQRWLFFSGAWAAQLEEFDIGGIGATPDEALDVLGGRLRTFRDAGTLDSLPRLDAGRQAEVGHWFSHWSWRLKPKENRPRLETYSVDSLLRR